MLKGGKTEVGSPTEVPRRRARGEITWGVFIYPTPSTSIPFLAPEPQQLGWGFSSSGATLFIPPDSVHIL